ncbi:MAG: radical SAM protein [Treponema sp.]|nr:radical SAM protein [Treponema sp.]
MKIPVICTSLLIEKSPQALPLGAACIASAIKHNPETSGITEVSLKSFSLEDKKIKELKMLSEAEFETDAETGAGARAETETGADKKIAAFIAYSLYSEIKIHEEEQTQVQVQTQTWVGTKAIFCFSCFVWNIKILQESSRILRGRGCITIAGGPEITAHPDFYKDFDYCVSGEGEDSVPSLIKKIIDERKKDNQSSEKKTDESDKSTAIHSFSPDLSKLYSPYLDGILNPSEYEGALWELARGCPFKCSYCYESKGEKKVRYFPMERIKAELDLFAAKKVPQVFVLDPTYNVNKKRAIELLRLIAKKTPDTFYYFEARVEFIDRELAREFTKIPCALQIGLQSANENVLHLVNRPFDKKKFIRNIGILNEEGVTFGLDLIFGLPGETFASFRDGIDFAISLYPNNLEIFCLSVLPGTDLFDRAEALGLVWEKVPTYHVIKTKDFTADDLKRAEKLSKACTYFYNSGRAVPWFNSVCRLLKIKASKFFEIFYDKNADECERFCSSQSSCGEISHIHIQKIQLDFLRSQFSIKNLMKYFPAVEDIVKFYGAISRTTDTGKGEIILLNYDAEYVASDYASDIKYFVENLRPKKCRIETFMNKGQADFRMLRIKKN